MTSSACSPNTAAIELCAIQKTFATTRKRTTIALNNINATVPSGVITGLVGPDGAGKTTLIRVITGLLLPTQGSVLVLGRNPAEASPKEMSEVGYMPQRFGLYEDLSVIDNLQLHAALRGLTDDARRHTFAKLLAFTDLAPFTTRLAGQLSGGMKQKLGLACALLGTPKVLLLDEPGVGVDPLSRRELWQMVTELAADGISILWSTAYMDEAERCAHVLVLETGRLIYAGAPSAFTQRVQGRVFTFHPPVGQTRATLAAWSARPDVCDALIQGSAVRVVLTQNAQAERMLVPAPPRLEDAYMAAVGGADAALQGVSVAGQNNKALHATSHINKAHSSRLPVSTEYAISARNLTKRFGNFVAASNVSFDVLPGTIFGLLGPNGAGKSTTFRMLCGLSKPTTGECRVAGIDMLHAGGSAKARLGYMAQKFSLYNELTVRQNMRLMAELYGLPHAAQRVDERLVSMGLAAVHAVKAGELPLGHKQRLSMACATLHDPPVLFLDEPTSGVDPRTRREFWHYINAMTESGVAVLVTTHFMEEAEYCDAIALIVHGKLVAQGAPDDIKAHCPRTADTPHNPTLEDAFIAYITAQKERLHQEKNWKLPKLEV